MSFSGDVIPDGVQYKQCLLASGKSRQVSFIPLRYARLGKVLSLKGDDGEWTAGWRVVEVWGEAVTDPPDHHRFISQRRRSR